MKRKPSILKAVIPLFAMSFSAHGQDSKLVILIPTSMFLTI